MKKRVTSFALALCLIVTMFPALTVKASAAEDWQSYTELSTVSSSVLNGGQYKVTSNTTKDNLEINGDVTIYIAKGVTLSSKGNDGSGVTAGKAGISLPYGSTLTLRGEGTVNAVGGNAGNGANGVTPTAAYVTTIKKAGEGGDGGGGAGAGIGGKGGDGGLGGFKFIYAQIGGALERRYAASGSSGTGMGTLYVMDSISLQAIGGSAGTGGKGGNGGPWAMADYTVSKQYPADGHGGGGGGGGGAAAYNIGGGGAGGGGGASGDNHSSVGSNHTVNGKSGQAGENGTKYRSGAGGQGGLNGCNDSYYPQWVTTVGEAIDSTGGGTVYYTGACTINGVSGSELKKSDLSSYSVAWEALATSVEFADADTGSSTKAELPETQDVEDSQSPVRPADPKKDGYTFDNWYTSADCTELYDFNTTYAAGSPKVTVYAKFVPNTYEASFDQTGGENGQSGTVKATFDKPLTGSVSVPTMPDCEFLGYYSDKTGGNQYFDRNGNATSNIWLISNNTILYAQWNDVRKVIIGQAEETPSHGTAGSSVYSIIALGFKDTVFETVIEWDGKAPAGVTAEFSETAQSGSVLTIATTEETPAGIYTFKIKSKNSPQETKTVAFNVWEDLSKASYSVKDNTISGTTTAMEYKLSGDEWKTCENGTTKVTYAEGQQLIIRDKNFPERTRDMMDSALTIPEAPKSGVTYSVKDGTVSGLGDTYEYSINGGEWTDKASDVTFVPGTVQVRTKATDSTLTSHPEALASVPAVAEAPTYVIDYTNETTTTAVSSADEYKKDDGKWTSGTDEVLSLKPGSTYTFRTAATDAALASKEQTVTAPKRPADPKEDQDYSIDYENGTLQLKDGYAASESKNFDTLVPNGSELKKGAHYYVRKQATADAFKSNTVTFTTAKAIEAPNAPEAASKKDTSITVDGILGQEYAIRKAGESSYGKWQTSGVFEGLQPDTNYEIVTRIAAVSTGKNKAFPSEVSEPLTVKTKKAAADAPTLEFETIDTTSVTIKPVEGAEYSCSATKKWQDSNVFENLEPGKKYTFYIRIKADEDMPSGKTGNSVAYTKAAAPKADVVSVDYGKETISFDDSIYEVNTQPDGSGTSVANGSSITDYISADGENLYVRVKDALYEGSDWTKFDVAARPAAPDTLKQSEETVKNKKDGKISGVDTDMEYKIGDGEWKNVEKTPLTGFSNETVTVRTKATDSAPHSEEVSFTFTPSEETLTVTYDLNGGTGVAEPVTGLAYGDTLTAPEDPTKDNSYFAGWTTDKAGTTSFIFGEDGMQVTDNMTLYAKWNKDGFNVTGKVLETDENGKTSNAANAEVKVMQGNVVFDSITTDKHGNYTLDNIPAGTYNLVAGKDNKTMIVLVRVAKNTNVQNIVLPYQSVNSQLEVKYGTPNIMVGELDNEAKSNAVEGENVLVKMTVSSISKDKAIAEAAKENALAFFDMNVKRTVGSNEPEAIHETNNVLEIAIPFKTEERDIVVYRNHNDEVTALTKLNSKPENAEQFKDGTYFVEDGYVLVYANKFSHYAVAYNETSYTVNVPSVDNGTVAANPKDAVKDEEVIITVTPDEGYKLKSITVTDKDGKEISLTDKGDGKYGFTMPSGKVDVKAAFEKITYDITLPTDIENGKISADPKNAGKGDEVTITVTPDAGYTLKDLTIKDKDGNKLDLTDKGDGKYSFTMPDGKVSAEASFEKTKHEIELPTDIENGKITADPKNASEGDEVTITVTPDAGYTLKDLTIKDKDGNKIDLTDKGDGKYSFTMPDGKVSAEASFEKTKHEIELPTDIENGKISADPKNASEGDEVTITVTPDAGYTLKDLTIKDKDGNKIDLTDKGDGKYSFTMPDGKVSVEASFEKSSKWDNAFSTCPKDDTCPIAPYKDAKATEWYHDGVHFCLDNKLMVGYEDKTFQPNTATSRAMITTILWRLEGEPTASYSMSFQDVADGRWYTEAIRWAQSAGVVTGYDANTFGADDTMTREQMITVLYRYAQYKGVDVSAQAELSAFSDAANVSNYAVPAVKWAVGTGLVIGEKQNGNAVINPKNSTTRAQAATMLMRYCTNIVK